MIHGDVSADLLGTIFTPKSPLHDGAVIIRDDRIVAAGALLPLAETSIHTERFGTRHRAALGITEQTDAVVVVVSEENGQISLVERARIVRNLTESGLARAIQVLLDPAGGRRGAFGWRPASSARGFEGRSPRLARARPVRRAPGRDRTGRRRPPRRRCRRHGRARRRAAAQRRRRRRLGHDPASATPDSARRHGAAMPAGRRPSRRPRRRATLTPSRRRPPEPRGEADPRRIFNNWPLKLAAVGLATLMYGGLALSQNTQTYLGRDHRRDRQPAAQDGRPHRSLRRSPQIRYFAPDGVPVASSTFIATVDLVRHGRQDRDRQRADRGHHRPIRGSTSWATSPSFAPIELDLLVSKPGIPVTVVHGPVPDGLTLGTTTVDPPTVTISGAQIARLRRSSRSAPTSSSSRPASTSTRTSGWSRSTSSATRSDPSRSRRRRRGSRSRSSPIARRGRCRSTRSSPATRPPGSRSNR